MRQTSKNATCEQGHGCLCKLSLISFPYHVRLSIFILIPVAVALLQVTLQLPSRRTPMSASGASSQVRTVLYGIENFYVRLFGMTSTVKVSRRIESGYGALILLQNLRIAPCNNTIDTGDVFLVIRAVQDSRLCLCSMQPFAYRLFDEQIIYMMMRGRSLINMSKASKALRGRSSHHSFAAEWVEKLKEDIGYLKGNSASVQ